MFMTDRTFHPAALFQPVYSCNPDTDELQIGLELVSRLTDPPVEGGLIGIQTAGETYEFRYTPPNNHCKLLRLLLCTYRMKPAESPKGQNNQLLLVLRLLTRMYTIFSTRRKIHAGANGDLP